MTYMLDNQTIVSCQRELRSVVVVVVFNRTASRGKSVFVCEMNLRKKCCCVHGCYDLTSKRHRFPSPKRYPDTFKKWLNLIKPFYSETMTDTEVYNRYVVCAKHFESSDLVPGKRGLKVTAIPNVFVQPKIKLSLYATNTENQDVKKRPLILKKSGGIKYSRSYEEDKPKINDIVIEPPSSHVKLIEKRSHSRSAIGNPEKFQIVPINEESAPLTVFRIVAGHELLGLSPSSTSAFSEQTYLKAEEISSSQEWACTNTSFMSSINIKLETDEDSSLDPLRSTTIEYDNIKKEAQIDYDISNMPIEFVSVKQEVDDTIIEEEDALELVKVKQEIEDDFEVDVADLITVDQIKKEIDKD